MSNFQNCFNGCTETISDQCVKYTGIDFPVLGISTGDPLPVIENALITFLISALDGSGIKIDLSGIDICAVVQKYLPTCGEISIEDISKALIEAVCDIQDQVNSIFASLTVLNSDYVIGCLTGVTVSSDTHDIVQAIITKLCTVNTSVTSILSQLPSYALKSEICTLVEACANQNTTNLASDKMLPYSPIPYYGATSGYPTSADGFSITGSGYGYWLNVYLCNGGNPGVPDLRGRVAVGSTDMGSANWPTQTQPGVNGNPTYTYKNAYGQNTVILALPQIPTHNHTGSTSTTIISPATHSHLTVGASAENTLTAINAISQGASDGGNTSYSLTGSSATATIGKSSDVTLSATTTLTIIAEGNNAAHINYQPGLAVYYIIYIPA